MKRVVLIDAHAVIHRAYHALPPLTTPGGEPSNAVYGFTAILLRILRELKPDHIAAAFDLAGPTFRHLAYERYKAQRPETPSELSSQFSKVREVLAAFGIPIFEKEGYEADDIIGTIAKKLEPKKDTEVIVVTGDMDALGLVRPRLKVYSMKKGISETTIYDEKAVRERYGLKPAQLTDLKGLKGDPSDNIPGVKGIGEKTAIELIKKFGSLEGIYRALRKRDKRIRGGVAEKLRAGREDAEFSRELGTINESVPIDFKLEEVRWRNGAGNEVVRKTFQKFGFFSLLRRLGINGLEKKQMLQQSFPTAVPVKTARTKILKSVKDFDGVPSALVLGGSALFRIPTGGDIVFELAEEFYEGKDAQKFFAKDGWHVHDGKSILRFLRQRGIELGEVGFDTMLAAYLVSTPGRDFSLPAILAREGEYVGEDPYLAAARFWDAARALDAKLNDGKIRKVFEEIELPIIRILADLEERGIRIDAKFLEKLAGKVNGELEALTKEIHTLAGGPFNINSPRQISAILFEKLGIKTYGLRKTAKGGVISTGAAELEKLRGAHPIVEKILSYRELTKLKTTYLDVLPTLVDPKTRRLHTTFNQTVTATGRLSSSDPNLQNIPIMSELGREVRKAFVAEKGYELVSFDYSQIELRVAAHLADDKKMIGAFRRGEDIHRLTASEVFNVPLEKVTPVERRAAKTLNFGILYGMGSQALAEATNMNRDEAKKFIDEYFRDFSGIKKYIENTLKFVEENGYVETLFGRRRYISEIHSPNWQMKREAERMAVNMPIQGTATGDIIKMAMIKVEEWIRGRTSTAGGSTSKRAPEDIRLLLQVHDELLFEVKESLVKKAAPEIKKIMENVTDLNVPLVVEVKAGPNWKDQESI